MAEVEDMLLASTGREDREITKNIWSSKDKVESEEYVLSRPPKKPGGEDVDDADTAATISQVSTTTLA